MKIKITDIAKEGATIINVKKEARWILRYFNPADAINNQLKNDIEISLSLHAFEDEVFIDGNIKTTLQCECSRCLIKFDYNIDHKLKLTLLPDKVKKIEDKTKGKKSHMNAKENTLEIDINETSDYGYYKGDEIDFLTLLGEQLTLALPIYFVCKEDCKGLCQYCGKNKNKIKCNCKDHIIDSRFEKLKSLKLEN